MKHAVGLSLMAGVLFTCMAVSSGQATPISTPIKPALATKSSGIVSQVYLRGRYYRGVGVRRYYGGLGVRRYYGGLGVRRYYGGLGVRPYAYRAYRWAGYRPYAYRARWWGYRPYAYRAYRPYVARRYYAAPYRNSCLF